MNTLPFILIGLVVGFLPGILVGHYIGFLRAKLQAAEASIAKEEARIQQDLASAKSNTFTRFVDAQKDIKAEVAKVETDLIH